METFSESYSATVDDNMHLRCFEIACNSLQGMLFWTVNRCHSYHKLSLSFSLCTLAISIVWNNSWCLTYFQICQWQMFNLYLILICIIVIVLLCSYSKKLQQQQYVLSRSLYTSNVYSDLLALAPSFVIWFYILKSWFVWFCKKSLPTVI